MRTALPTPRPNPAFNIEIEVYTKGQNDCHYYETYESSYDDNFYENEQAQINAITEFYNEQTQNEDQNFPISASDTTMK